MPSPVKTLKLGARKFSLKKPKLGDLRAIVDALDVMQVATGGALITASADLVLAGLLPAHPELTAADLLDTEATVVELNEAVAAVLTMAGLRPVDDAPGEAVPQLLAS